MKARAAFLCLCAFGCGVAHGDDPSVKFNGVAMLYSQGRFPEELLIRSLRIAPDDPSLERIETVLVAAWKRTRGALKDLLRNRKACLHESSTSKEPHEYALPLDHAIKRLYEDSYASAMEALSGTQRSIMVDFLERLDVGHVWLIESADPQSALTRLCDCMGLLPAGDDRRLESAHCT